MGWHSFNVVQGGFLGAVKVGAILCFSVVVVVS